MNNQTTEQLKRIDAKRTLGLPLTPSENAFYTLYGNFETIAAPLVDIIKADPTDIEPSEATQKTAFVHGYLSPLLRAAGLNINNAKYRKHTDSNEEIVTVTYEAGLRVIFALRQTRISLLLPMCWRHYEIHRQFIGRKGLDGNAFNAFRKGLPD